jgi:hypothetical protein
MNPRAIQVTLPEQSKQRLDELVMQRDLAMDQQKALQARINMCDDTSDSLIRDRLIAEHSKQALRANHLQRLVSACNQYLMQLRLAPGTTLELHPALNLTIKTSLPKAVESTREQIADLQREIARTRALPLKHSSKQEGINRYLAGLALRFQPRVAFDQFGNAKVIWNEDLVHSKSDVLGILYWIAPSSVTKAFAELMLAHEDEPEDAVSPQEREQQINKFNGTLLQLERQEEALISCAAADGHEITRRPDASPMAVLNLVIVQEEQQQQVA